MKPDILTAKENSRILVIQSKCQASYLEPTNAILTSDSTILRVLGVCLSVSNVIISFKGLSEEKRLFFILSKPYFPN